MWQAYQYGHGKLRLVKDLKTGQAHLRVSLIDQEQIDNMGRIFNQRKHYYRIDDQSLKEPPPKQEVAQEESTAHLSYKEKVQLYRKKMQSEKLQDKYNNLFRKTEKRRFQMRNPILYKLLLNFEESHKHEDNSRVVDDLKESQKNLQMIKINTNRRAVFQDRSVTDISAQRPRFISLEDGLPEKQHKSFPNWKDYAEGKFVKTDPTLSHINIAQLESNIDTVINNCGSASRNKRSVTAKEVRDAASQSRQKHISPISQAHHHNSSYKQATDSSDKNIRMQASQQLRVQDRSSKVKSAQQKRYLHSKTADNSSRSASRTFSRSQKYSKDVIATMSGFYDSKANKKEDYKKMVMFLKKDRPLTSEIRRKSYKMIGESNLEDVKKYRCLSEIQRLKLRQRNYQFYIALLKAMEVHTIEQLPLSAKIIDRIKLILESNYVLSKQHFLQVVDLSFSEPSDAKSQFLVQQMEKLLNKQSMDDQFFY